MPLSIPDCYEADRQFEARDLAYTAKITRRGRCVKCGGFLLGETVLDLSAFGLAGEYACQHCADNATVSTEDLDEV